MTHTLHVWAEEAKVATIEHEGRDDRWGLNYAEPWVADAQSFPLSPALPLMRPAADYASLHPLSASLSICCPKGVPWM